MISLYIIAGFFLQMGCLLMTAPLASEEPDNSGKSGLWSIFIGAAILAFTEWARATGVF